MGEELPIRLNKLPWGDWVDPRAVVGVQFFGEDEHGWQISVIVIASGNRIEFPSPVYENEDELEAMMERTVRSIAGTQDD